jgi:hypothetical protein
LRDPFHRTSDNGHPISGATRDSARQLIVAAIDAIGARKFELSPAGRTLDEDACWHQHYAVGDLHRSVSDQTPTDKDVIVGIDVDYYIKAPDEVFGYEVPCILHTFQPTSVCGMDGESPFRIISDYVHYDVSGGSAWKHQVWDWTKFGEHLEFRCQRTSAFGVILSWLGFEKCVYQKVHHARPWSECPHRALVWLLPQYTAWKCRWLPSDLQARRLSRIQFADPDKPGWNILASIQKNEVWVSFGRQGEDACMDMRKDNFDVLMGLQSAQSVTSRALGMGYSLAKDLALLGQYFRGALRSTGEIARLARPVTVQVHWPASFEAEIEECSARSYAAPVVTDENLMPMIKRWECLSDSLERRVTFVKNTVEPPRRYESLAEEFVRLVVPIQGKGHPLTLEFAAEMLSKPSQVLAVANIWETVDMQHRQLIESFVKNEPTMKNGRIISSFPDARFLLKFSTYTLKFRDEVLHGEHNRHWFCPGMRPPDIAAKVQEYVGSVFVPAEGDYSNLDGSVSLWLQRRVMNAVYHRYFHPRWRGELTSYTDMMVSCPARAKRFGFRYDAGVGVKSGSPTTCDMNTVVNAFVMYCAIRRSLPDLPKAAAYQHIGLAFGDDSLFDGAFKNAWVKAATDLGLTLKVEKCKPETGVTFLARVFPDPWSSLTSFQDPLRTWRKLHLTMRDPTVPIADAAVDRLEGYLITDRFTPVTSEYADALVRYYLPRCSAKRATRKDRNREVPYWLTIGGAWPQDPEDVDMMRDCIAARLGLPVEDVRTLASACANISDPWVVPTLDRRELDVPYVNTIDREGNPSEGQVDLRILERDQHVHRVRANRRVAGTYSVRGDGHEGGSNMGSHHRHERPARSAGVQRVPELVSRSRTEGHGQPVVEAQTSAIPDAVEQRGEGVPVSPSNVGGQRRRRRRGLRR